MPLFMDIHSKLSGVTPEALKEAHAKDVEVQKKYGVEYQKYYFNESAGKAFCLVHAPNAEVANQVHLEAHGLVAEKIIEINPPELAGAFLGATEINEAGAALIPGGKAHERDPGIRTILFTDIVESTALTQTLGDEQAMTLLNVHDTIVRNALSSFGGREIKHTGDGIMASFFSAASAVKCASLIQRELANHPRNLQDFQVKVRIGTAAGEPVEQHQDLFGSTVQLAARLCAHASPQQILVSNAVAELCLGKGLSFQEVGEIIFKGFDRPIRTYAVEWGRAAK